jgi:hypothetical protein
VKGDSQKERAKIYCLRRSELRGPANDVEGLRCCIDANFREVVCKREGFTKRSSFWDLGNWWTPFDYCVACTMHMWSGTFTSIASMFRE